MKWKAKELLRKVTRKVEASFLTVPCYYLMEAFYALRVASLRRPHISSEDQRNVEQNVTFIYKSFNRQGKAKRLYRCIKSYYPNVTVIIADDSEVPLRIDGADIVHLPFNSGVSKGLIAALGRVQTPYVMRLDDDAVLTPRSRIHGQLAFLQRHLEVDLCSIQAVKFAFPERSAKSREAIRMNKQLIVPAGTQIDGHTVVYKPTNWFVARTEAVRKVGWDPNIRVIDHNEFFTRAAGQIVCVHDPHAYALHWHNRFDWRYRPYRSDWQGDARYIWAKQRAEQRIARQ